MNPFELPLAVLRQISDQYFGVGLEGGEVGYDAKYSD